MSEMIATANAKSIEEIKSFLSKQKETYKVPYEMCIRDRFANDLSQDTASGKGDTEERKAHIQNLLNFFPVIGEDEEGEMIPLDAEKVLSIPRKIKSKEVVRMGFQSNFLFQNISNAVSYTHLNIIVSIGGKR